MSQDPSSPQRPDPLDSSVTAESEEPKQNSDNIRFAWGEWDLGGKFIFVSACVACVSMLMKWVDLGIISSSGFSQGAFLGLGVFVYPVWKLLKQQPIKFYVGIGCAIGGMLIAISFMSKKTVSFGDRSAFLFGAGPVFFLLACGALAFGVYKYRRTN